MREFTNDGSARPPRLLVYGNQWGLGELPRRPSELTWSFSECLEKLVAHGFDGCQATPDKADEVRALGLRYATSGRANSAEEIDALAARAAGAGADCLTLHLAWGMEPDAEVDALLTAVQTASERYALPIFPETHRATVFQDIWRICRAIERNPWLRFNGDFSHLYCGQEMGYRGFASTRDYLHPVYERTRFIHARVSDGQCMQCDLHDPAKRVHLENFAWMWRQVWEHFQATAGPGDFLAFTPELGPPGSGYSLTVPGPDGVRAEIVDRWADTLLLKDLAKREFMI